MEQSSKYDGFKYEDGAIKKVTDEVTVESALQITINDKPFTVVMQTPGNEKELAAGLLYAEDVIQDFENVKWRFNHNKFGIIDEALLKTAIENLGDGFKSSRSLLSVSSCGICGKREIGDLLPNSDSLKTKERFSFEQLSKIFDQLTQSQQLFDKTGGCHGIAAFDANLKLICSMEDIGRHNALDKVVGGLLLNKKLSEAKVLAISGRLSYEMVSKAFRAKIPIIAAVSAPSSLAIDFAKEYDMTLIAFSRKSKATCYSGQHRILS